jgi:hypothetical protein
LTRNGHESPKHNSETGVSLKALTDELRRALVIEVACRTRWSSPLHLLRHRANLLLHKLGVLVASPEFFGDLRRNSAFGQVSVDVFGHLDFGLTEIPDQLAFFARWRVALARSLDQLAALLRLYFGHQAWNDLLLIAVILIAFYYVESIYILLWVTGCAAALFVGVESWYALPRIFGMPRTGSVSNHDQKCIGLQCGFPDNCLRLAAEMGLAMQTHVDTLSPRYPDLRLRIGIHTGPVVAGVIGENKFAYDLGGDNVNIASRMESHGLAGRIHVSEAFVRAADDKWHFEARGSIEVKGQGPMNTYFLSRHSAS